MSQIEQKIAVLIEPAVADAGFELVRVKVGGGHRKTLQVMAERADRTMTAEDCAKLSRRLSPLLDEADPFGGAYTLEVSSPGIDRPLTRLKDFSDWQGHEARLELNRLVAGKKRFRGVLAGTDGDVIRLDAEGEEGRIGVPFASVASARLVLTETLVRESLKAAKDAARKTRDKMETEHDRR